MSTEAKSPESNPVESMGLFSALNAGNIRQPEPKWVETPIQRIVQDVGGTGEVWGSKQRQSER